MDLIPLLKRKDMPLLKHLGLVNHELGDKVMELVLDSPLLPQLESLDLSKSSLGDKAASLILASQDKLKHLKSVDLSENFISDTLSEQLAALPGYKLNGQRNLEEYDYYEENDENGEPKRYCVLGE
jgi:Leucine-rich repeat (LRR) protein